MFSAKTFHSEISISQGLQHTAQHSDIHTGPIAGKTKDMTSRHGNNGGTWRLLVEDISRT